MIKMMMALAAALLSQQADARETPPGRRLTTAEVRKLLHEAVVTTISAIDLPVKQEVFFSENKMVRYIPGQVPLYFSFFIRNGEVCVIGDANCRSVFINKDVYFFKHPYSKTSRPKNGTFKVIIERMKSNGYLNYKHLG